MSDNGQVTKTPPFSLMKLSQDTTNEIWSITLRREYETPGARKRAIERNIRAALETALGLPSTIDGHEDGVTPIGEATDHIPKPNPYEDQSPTTYEKVIAVRHPSTNDDLVKQLRWPVDYLQGPNTVMIRDLFKMAADRIESLSAQLQTATTDLGVECYVGDMKTSAGMEYYVCLRRNDKTITPHMFKVRGKAEYEVAEYNHFFNDGPEPDIMSYDTDGPDDGESNHTTYCTIVGALDMTEASKLVEGWRHSAGLMHEGDGKTATQNCATSLEAAVKSSRLREN